MVREAGVSELALPTGTTKGYIEASRSKVDANTKIAESIDNGRWQGFKPRPLPDKAGRTGVSSHSPGLEVVKGVREHQDLTATASA